MQKAVKENRDSFKKWQSSRTTEDLADYRENTTNAKKTVTAAKDAGYEELNTKFDSHEGQDIGLYRDVWIAAIASSRASQATQTAAICVRFQGRRVRHAYVTMHITILTRKSALIYRRGLRQRVASLTVDCNGVFAIKAYDKQTGEN